MQRVKFLALVSLTAVFLLACTRNVGQAGVALRATDTQIGIGAVTADGTEQELTYSVTLQNYSDQAIHVQGVEPILSPEFNTLVLTETVWVMVDETVAPGETVTVNSTLLFTADDLTKEEINNLAPYITNIQVTTVTSLPLPDGEPRE